MTSKFDQIIPGVAELFKSRFATPGTYTQDGGDYDLDVIIDESISVYPDALTAAVAASEYEIEYYINDLDVSPARGDVITIPDGPFEGIYDVISPMSYDGSWAKLSVVKR